MQTDLIVVLITASVLCGVSLVIGVLSLIASAITNSKYDIVSNKLRVSEQNTLQLVRDMNSMNTFYEKRFKSVMEQLGLTVSYVSDNINPKNIPIDMINKKKKTEIN